MAYEVTLEGVCSVLLADLNSVVYQLRTVISAKMAKLAKKCPKRGHPPEKARFFECARATPLQTQKIWKKRPY